MEIGTRYAQSLRNLGAFGCIMGRKILIFYPIKYLPKGDVLQQACKQIAHEHFIYCSLCHIGHRLIL
jgi:hypothetical protein